MFVSIVCDLATDDHEIHIQHLLSQYGFDRVMKNTYESLKVPEKSLARLKRDIDRVTDYYDIIRIYQYPLEGTMVISQLFEKRWRKFILKD